ncbi:MAG: pro-sigmaK processing inhibitor BofA family protein [Bacillota bacterium]
MSIEPLQALFGVIFVIFSIYLIARVLTKPLRLLVRLVVNSLFGLLLLWGFNFLGTFLGMTIPINIVTILTAGFLGIPGLILLILLKILVGV